MEVVAELLTETLFKARIQLGVYYSPMRRHTTYKHIVIDVKLWESTTNVIEIMYALYYVSTTPTCLYLHQGVDNQPYAVIMKMEHRCKYVFPFEAGQKSNKLTLKVYLIPFYFLKATQVYELQHVMLV